MCLIITGAAGNMRRVLFNTPGLIESIYKINPDGLGVMFKGDLGAPRAFKAMPKTLEEAKGLLGEWLPNDDRQTALHARYTTHGDTDMSNCHPYELGGGYLMHNGVLGTGNADDVRKSDTWHYINDFLGDGACLLAPNIQRLVANHIGEGNRFVYLAPGGEMVHINKHTGVEYEGLWFANTYAWNVRLLDPKWGRGVWGRGVWGGCAEDDEHGLLDEWRDEHGELSWLLQSNENYLADVLRQKGVDALRGLEYEFGTPWRTYWTKLDAETNAVIKAAYYLQERNYRELGQMLAEGKEESVAIAAIYEVTWPDLDDDDDGELEGEPVRDAQVAGFTPLTPI